MFFSRIILNFSRNILYKNLFSFYAMDRIGIDIGTTKTVIYTSRGNGSAITDEFDKREMATVMELTSPKRSFGKGCSSDNNENLEKRERNFFQNILNTESQKHIFMYLEYLDRVIKNKGEYKNAIISIPEYFGNKEKTILKELCDSSSLKVHGFITHLTSVAAYAALLKSDVPASFMIVDFGSHKTSAGTFSFNEGKLTPMERFCCKIGAINFDEIINKILISKYNLPDTKLIREKIYGKLHTLKKGINHLDFIKTGIFTEDYKSIDVTLTKEEFIEAAKPELQEISNFINAVAQTIKGELHVEIVGKNYQNVFVQNILSEIDLFKNVHLTLHSSESAAHGACLALAVNAKKMSYKIEEISGFEISVKISGEDVLPTVIFKRESLIGSSMNIKYSRNELFNIDVYENGVIIGTINNVPSGDVVITSTLNPFGLFDITEMTVDGKSHTFEYSKLDKATDIEKIVELEKEFVSMEENIIKAGEIKNSTEQILDGLMDFLSKNNILLTSEESDKANDIIDEYFDLKMTKDLKKEEENRKAVFERLSFIEEKLKTEELKIKEELISCKKELNEFLKGEKSTISKRELIKYDYKFELAINNLNMSISNSENYDGSQYFNLISEYKKLLQKAIIELKNLEQSEKLIAEAKEAERIKAEKEEEEKKKKEEEKLKKEMERKDEEYKKEVNSENKEDGEVKSAEAKKKKSKKGKKKASKDL